jgi:queuine tRNA-ribosyltransferase
MNTVYIPSLTTSEGSALLAEDWERIGIHIVAYDLPMLLAKPGLDLLKQIPLLSRYVGWQGQLVLNASHLQQNHQGFYTVRSPYDGSIQQFSAEMILALIKTLQPDIFVLATGMFKQIDESLSKSMQIIIPYDDVFAMNHTDLYAGILLAFDETTEKLTDLMIKKEKIAHLNTPCYFSGSFSLQLHQQLKNLGFMWIESNRPAQDAVNGIVYCEHEVKSIQDLSMATAFEPLDDKCQCVACQSQLTRAYLHHLYLNTPALCQRFLIQHNVNYYKCLS